MHFWEWNILILISLKFVLKGPIAKKSALVQVMARHRTSDKPLSEAVLPQFTDIYASLGLNKLNELIIQIMQKKYLSLYMKNNHPSQLFA